MDFTGLLRVDGIDPGGVTLCLHKPGDLTQRALIATWVEERPNLFEAYQRTHPARSEATVKVRPYFASFLMTRPGELTFVGLYAREIGPVLDAATLRADAAFSEMGEVVHAAQGGFEGRLDRWIGRTRFDLRLLPALKTLARRLILRDPGGRAHIRRAETTPLEVLEIRRSARIAPPVPSWEELILTRADLASLPRDWTAALREWRGIYLIVDEADGARYVGAAYGAENLLGRWRAHVAGEAGVTAELKKRRAEGFRFSILERLSPDASADEVTAREQIWMDRLHTRAHGLNA